MATAHFPCESEASLSVGGEAWKCQQMVHTTILPIWAIFAVIAVIHIAYLMCDFCLSVCLFTSPTFPGLF